MQFFAISKKEFMYEYKAHDEIYIILASTQQSLYSMYLNHLVSDVTNSFDQIPYFSILPKFKL